MHRLKRLGDFDTEVILMSKGMEGVLGYALGLYYTLHIEHFTLHTEHCRLHTAHYTLNTANSALYATHCPPHTALFRLHSARYTLHTAHCTLQTTPCKLNIAHCTLHTAHFSVSPHLPICHSVLSSGLPPPNFNTFTNINYLHFVIRSSHQPSYPSSNL